MKCLFLAVPLVFAASILSAGDAPAAACLFLGRQRSFALSGPDLDIRRIRRSLQRCKRQQLGGTAGITLKILSTNERNAGALAAGVTYNFNGTFGCDIGLAWNDNDANADAGLRPVPVGRADGPWRDKAPGSSPTYVPPPPLLD